MTELLVFVRYINSSDVKEEFLFLRCAGHYYEKCRCYEEDENFF